jgi:hypothetical protein
MKTKTLQHRFVENMPDQLEEGILYISLAYCIAIHNCVCGCGNEVSTPISPAGWEVTFDGETVSLSPSIGNWSFTCQSHYFITRGEVRQAFTWTSKQIKKGREADAKDAKRYFKKKNKRKGKADGL